MSPRWFIALFMLFIINAAISNTLESADLITSTQMTTIQQSSEVQLTEVKDPNIGGAFTSGTTSLTSWAAILSKAFTSDYSFFYHVDYTLTQAQCALVSGGRWNTTITACQYPNEFMILRYILYWPLTAAVTLFAILLLIQAVRGG